MPWHKRLWLWVKTRIVSDVTEANALCEFDCREPDCKEEDWANCERRIQRGAGELWPGPKSDASRDVPQNQRRRA